jgi:Cu2+-exporting ATPase
VARTSSRAWAPGAARTATAAEADSEHPLARAVVAAARERGPIPAARDFRSMTGRGVEAIVGGERVAVGGPALLRERGLSLPDALAGDVAGWQARGAAVLYVVRAGEVAGALALEDEVRPESREAVERLRAQGVAVAMVTGDAREVADAVAEELGIDEVFAEVLPEDKDGAVAEIQRRGRRVAIVLASDDPRGVLRIMRLSRASHRKMVQNLVWAAGYNVVAIPVAAGALAWAGVTLAPAAAAVLMSVSTVVVALNAQLLRRLDLAEV